MLKHTRGKADKMELSTIALFNHMTDDDFIAIHDAGQMMNLCYALTLDLQSQSYKKNNNYLA
jgi:hypothetical protein